jgi:hypothetical protein
LGLEDKGIYYQSELSKEPSTGGVYRNQRPQFIRYFAAFHYGFALDGFFPATGGNRLNEILRASADLTLLGKEEIDTAICYAVAGTTPYGKAKLWLDPQCDFVLRRATLVRGANDLYEDDKPISAQPTFEMYEGQSLVGWSGEVTGVRAEIVQGRFLPTYGHFQIKEILSGGRDITHSVAYTRSTVDLSPDFRRTRCFDVDLPEGTPVNYVDDPDAGIGFVWRNNEVMIAGDDFSGRAKGQWETTPIYRLVFLGITAILVVILAVVCLRRRFSIT